MTKIFIDNASYVFNIMQCTINRDNIEAIIVKEAMKSKSASFHQRRRKALSINHLRNTDEVQIKFKKVQTK